MAVRQAFWLNRCRCCGHTTSPSGCNTLSDDRGRPDLAAVRGAAQGALGEPPRRGTASGLLLFSSDGALTHKLLSPRAAVEKEYVATCEVADGAGARRPARAGAPEGVPCATASLFLGGVEIDLLLVERRTPTSLRTATPTQRRPACRRPFPGEVCVADVLEALVADDDRVTVRLVVREGKRRMVRRMLANVGAPVVGLRREQLRRRPFGRAAPVAMQALADDAWSEEPWSR